MMLEKNYRNAVLNSLLKQAQTDKAQAEVRLRVLIDHPAGIGDHSTTDLHNNLNEALSKLADAEDRIETLARFDPAFSANKNIFPSD